jgi:hypothetical protein
MKPETYIGTPSDGATGSTLMPAFCHCTTRAFHMMPTPISSFLSACAKASLVG